MSVTCRVFWLSGHHQGCQAKRSKQLRDKFFPIGPVSSLREFWPSSYFLSVVARLRLKDSSKAKKGLLFPTPASRLLTGPPTQPYSGTTVECYSYTRLLSLQLHLLCACHRRPAAAKPAAARAASAAAAAAAVF